MFVFVVPSCLFIAALWSPAGKRWHLGSLVCKALMCFVTFSCDVLGGVGSLIKLIPDHCLITYFIYFVEDQNYSFFHEHYKNRIYILKQTGNTYYK